MSMLEIKLHEGSDFLKIRETLTRMGVADNTHKILYQSCYILSKRGKMYICHLKELLRMDGLELEHEFNTEDEKRRNGIAKCLEEWSLCTIVEPEKHDFSDEQNFRIISHAAKKEWRLIPKYKFG